MADDRRVAAALLERHGQTFADEAGISVSGGSPKALFQLLELTILLSARVQRQVWEEVRPFAGRAAVAGAKALGIPANPADLASLVAEGDVTRLMAALVRVDLAGDADEVRAAAG